MGSTLARRRHTPMRPLQSLDGPAPMTTARDASERLLRALLTIASQEQRTHCSDPGLSELWLSDHEGERAEAARLCIGCPVITECGAAAIANDERWGVWGGHDRTVRPGRPKKAAA
jgi:hypothetical protein